MFRGRGWFGGGGLRKPKNPHSLEHLKYLQTVLAKNQVVTEGNKSLLVETLRSIAEILIWGDQNDSTVFDFFLEKNMLLFFLKIMDQNCGSYVCVQLLQTLNIMFENIRDETSLYYLLSNNHVNSIIVHKFDFLDEEVMAYYISFLKTLSLKLNRHTIHFFHNEHTNDFPLYTEAIKFFDHPESMVRIAVRTLTLNVYRVDDKSMLKFIRDKTAAPYFSNLVWFIGSHVLELDACVRQDAGHQSRSRLGDLVAEHLDHMHYLNDILSLSIQALNEVLVDHLVQRLLVPLYVYSLTKRDPSHVGDLVQPAFGAGSELVLPANRPRVDRVVGLFLLSQVFLIIAHVPLVRALARIIFNGNMEIFSADSSGDCEDPNRRTSPLIFSPPAESLEDSLREELDRAEIAVDADAHFGGGEHADENEPLRVPDINVTDEEKERMVSSEPSSTPYVMAPTNLSLSSRPFLEAVLNSIELGDDDYSALFGLCFVLALMKNKGLDEAGFGLEMPIQRPCCDGQDSSEAGGELTSDTKLWFSMLLVDRLVNLICSSCYPGSRVRLATLELSVRILLSLVCGEVGASANSTLSGKSKTAIGIQDSQLAALEGAKEEATLQLRTFYKGEEIFLDMFEDEYNELKRRPQNVERLMMDASLLLPPTPTPMSGIEFSKRLPCGEVERARRAIRVFFLLRELTLTLRGEPETELPLTNPQSCIQVEDVLDLNNTDIIGCSMVTKEKPLKIRRYLAIDSIQLIVVEPHSRKLGWGVAKVVGLLQDMEATGDRDDPRCLHVIFNRPVSNGTHDSRPSKNPVMTAKFLFEDHIRCMAAKQKLTKGRQLARQKKIQLIAKILEFPSEVTARNSSSTSTFSLSVSSAHRFDPRSRRGLHRYNAADVTHSTSGAGTLNDRGPVVFRPVSAHSPRRLFQPGLTRVPGVAALATVATTSFMEEPPRSDRNKVFAAVEARECSSDTNLPDPTSELNPITARNERRTSIPNGVDTDGFTTRLPSGTNARVRPRPRSARPDSPRIDSLVNAGSGEDILQLHSPGARLVAAAYKPEYRRKSPRGLFDTELTSSDHSHDDETEMNTLSSRQAVVSGSHDAQNESNGPKVRMRVETV